jgi:nicotinate-nucleotide pyrophosphorylase (carboxylating)
VTLSRLERDLLRYLAEDRFGHDVTSKAVIPAGLVTVGELTAQERGVASGIQAAARLARNVGVKATAHVRDGATVRPGQRLMTLEGYARTVLGVERTLANLVMHLSGIATETRKMVEAAKSVNNRFRISATRKTLPGLRDLEKAAVVHGGGEPHRRDLSSAILIKGNHAAIVGFSRALDSARRYARKHSLELMVEIATEEEAVAAARSGADRLLLDNLTPEKVRKVVERLKAEGLRNRVVLEVSGGITLKNIKKFAMSGADIASSGHLTHSAPALSMHLVIKQ